ncbi:MFS transporter [Lachnoclostridium sp. Marseille-P6806]|uniref:MFS transporter n=1 Tax=Lachnoclostridium sp. Marseille-P6806 TaxID=2364793 RepID=UPI001030803C|nr:MFS transporter [Lachnoclostridium sp. Marseille-P6806]
MKLNYRRTILIGLAFLSISAFWQTYDNIIPLMLQNTFGLKETVTGSLMAMDNVLALFLLPLLGSISDRVDTKLGRRMPFIAAGTVLAVSFYILIALADRAASLPLFLIVLFGALISMGLYRSPAVALMPDLTPNVLRSKANAVINLMGTVGAVYALVMIRLLSGRTLSSTGRTDYLPLFGSVALLMVVAVAVLLLTIREHRVKQQVNEEIRLYRQAHPEDTEVQTIEDAGSAKGTAASPQKAGKDRAGTRPAAAMPADVKRSMIFLLLSIFLWFTAYNAVTTAFSRYAENVWQMRNGGYASCLLVATLAAVASYIPIGHISSRIGRKRTILIGIVLMLLCYMTAAFVTEYAFWLNFLFGLIGIGWAAINVNSYPMVVEMSRGADIGKFTGTYYTFSMAAQIFTPVFSGFLLEHVSYRTLFPYALLFSAAALLTMTQVRHGDIRPAKKSSALESFDVDD